ncbi:hypothetical protein [Thiomicrospira sp. ALE5]|uniref:hypothetical protein n=1 Tax=Thiomicrospira sp. ALE5 TaxID=748650 RepID=UPI0008E70390|nr:hypothetical protein [Thiomicrospira sp. ALE5]SFR52852.1 hypothetical protein SAMN03092900_0762 [Thiomicrospira sp. ALE5]
MYKFYYQFQQLTAGLLLGLFLVTAQAESKSTDEEVSLPLIESQQAAVQQVDIRLSEIPLGASKVVLAEQDNLTLYVWPTAAGGFEFMPFKGDLGAVKQFDANLGYNWRFERNGKRWQAKRVNYQSQYEKEFGHTYDRLTRGNPVLKEIGLFNESKVIECLQTRGRAFSKDPNHTWTREEAIENYAGEIRLFGRDAITKPSWEDLKACSPGMLTSLLYLDKARYKNLYEVGLYQAAKEEGQWINEEAQRINEEGQRLDRIIKKLSGQ